MKEREQRGTNNFYAIMSEMYGKGECDEKHESPTKRLVEQKNTAFENKKIIHDNVTPAEYSIQYTAAPGKSYVVEPHGGELDYQKIYKDPLGFYDQYFNQEITKIKVKDEVANTTTGSHSTPMKTKTVTSNVTTRINMIDSIKIKLLEGLREHLGEEFANDRLLLAMQDHTIENEIKKLMIANKIGLLDSNNKEILSQQIKVAGSG